MIRKLGKSKAYKFVETVSVKSPHLLRVYW